MPCGCSDFRRERRKGADVVEAELLELVEQYFREG